MHRCMTLFFLLSIGISINAQVINLRGTVSNTRGKPIANAIVTLAKQGLKDTTGPDGAYSITKNTNVVLPLLIPGKEDIFLEQGILVFSIPNPSPMNVEIFDAKGNLLQKESMPNAPTGFYRFNLGYGKSPDYKGLDRQEYGDVPLPYAAQQNLCGESVW